MKLIQIIFITKTKFVKSTATSLLDEVVVVSLVVVLVLVLVVLVDVDIVVRVVVVVPSERFINSFFTFVIASTRTPLLVVEVEVVVAVVTVDDIDAKMNNEQIRFFDGFHFKMNLLLDDVVRLLVDVPRINERTSSLSVI